METWKPIDGYPNYEVSNFGKVRSLNWHNEHKTRELFLKPHNKGYRQVELANDDGKKMFLVHRLVATAFIPNPNNYPQVNHIDADRTNNTAKNLEWCTQSQNMRYAYSLPQNKGLVRRGKRRGEKVLQLTLDGKIVATWEDARTIKVQTGMSDWSIAECCSGKRKTAYGYKWQYGTSYINE